jgi:hypothetical protein
VNWILVYQIEEGGYILSHRMEEGKHLWEAYRINLLTEYFKKLDSAKTVARDLLTRLGVPWKEKETQVQLFHRLRRIYPTGAIL